MKHSKNKNQSAQPRLPTAPTRVSPLRWVVLEQAFWVGIIGVLAAIGLGAALIALARLEDVPVVFNLQISLVCVLVVMALAGVSGLTALGGLRRADPGVLLR